MKKKVFNVLIIILGNMLLAMATSLFILPFNIDNGGTAGISVLLAKVIDPSLLIFILNWALFFIGFIVLKKQFAIKTLIATIVYPLCVGLFTKTGLSDIIVNQVDDPLLAAIIAALLTGVGLGLVYKVGGSTGGMDVVAYIMNKYLGIKLSAATFLLDFIVVFLGLFLVSVNSALYGMISIIISSYLIEVITVMGNSSYMMHIVSDKNEEIQDYIINDLYRGCTIICAKGGVNNTEKDMIELIFNEKEYYEIRKHIEEIDKNAFISIFKAVNVYGNGFEQIKTKNIKPNKLIKNKNSGK